MTNDPKISVIMSVYNGENYLSEAVDSILNQTFKDFEFIIINDGSTDGTGAILESYNDPRIVLVNQEHIGLTKSLNKGIALAKGQYIARQDADDISLNKRLENQLEFLKKNKNVALLGTAAEIIDERGKYLQTIKFPCEHSSIQKEITNYNSFIHGSVVFKRQCFFELEGYREFFLTSQDYDLWLRFIEKFEVANLSNPLYKHRITLDSVTLKKTILQKKMGKFAKQLAKARKKGINEDSLIKELKNSLKASLSVIEKKEIFQNYNRWCLLLLRKNKREAFLLMEEGIKFHPSNLNMIIFEITKIFHSSFLLGMVIRMWILFRWLKKERFYSKIARI
ncbi:MAG: glycosyltransferase family 2 protein [Promethearchaeota archaeon]|jgi:glycosyltransferase involved in cell wall biosynthesis